jgi:ribosome-associated toxin RatA of RatAB toxin-antitoxin module
MRLVLIPLFLLSLSTVPEELEKEMNLTLSRSIVSLVHDPSLLDKVIGKGEIVIIDETFHEIPWILSAGIRVNSSKEKIWNAIADFKNYNKWVPACRSVDVREWNERVVDAEIHLGFKFILLPFTVDYKVRHYHHPLTRTDWVGMGGEIEKTYGWHEIIPVTEKRNLFFFNIWAMPGSGFLKDLYEKYPFIDVGISISASAVYAKKLKDYVEKEKDIAYTEENEVAFSEEDEVKVMKEFAKRGPVLLFSPGQGNIMDISSWIRLKVPPEMAFDIVSDFSSYKYFERMIEKVKVKEKTEDTVKVEYKYDVRVTIIKVSPHFTLEYRLNKPSLITWNCVEGDRYIPEGFFKFYPMDDGTTLVKYRAIYNASEIGGLVSLILKIFPEGNLALNSYITQQRLRDLRHWTELPDGKKMEIMKEKEKKKSYE